MLGALYWFILCSLATGAILMVIFVLDSLMKNEKRALCVSLICLLLLLGLMAMTILSMAMGLSYTRAGTIILVLAAFILSLSMVLLLRKTPPNQRALKGTQGNIVKEAARFDEREQVFSRNRSLPPDPQVVEAFYRDHPQWVDVDERRRKRGGPLGQPGSLDRPGEGPNVAAMLSSFSIPMALGLPEIYAPSSHPHFSSKGLNLDPEEAALRVKGFALHLGADLVGICKLNPLWVYARRGEIFRGNWEDWGKEIYLDHAYVVVFAMEMEYSLVRAAPHTPSVLESAVVYAKGAFIATQLASFIANMGYSATANHIRHYDLLLVPVAVDAGLGEAGRFGYLITKQFGPRVRLGAVTTDMPMKCDRPVDLGVEHFCSICTKCARCCPSQSIPHGPLEVVNGTLRWKLHAESCFDYWGRIGTDCNVCMRVCPWSHPRTLPHRWIVEWVVRNRWVRRIFAAGDDLFYGKRPAPSDPPRWARYRAQIGQ